MTRRRWLDLLVDRATVPELEAHRRALRAGGEAPARVDAEARAAVEIALLLQERGQRAAELAALADIAGRLAAVTDPADLLVEIVDQARRLLAVDLTYVALLDGDDLQIGVASGQRSSRLVGTRLPRWAGLVGQVVESGEARWTSDYVADDDLVHEEQADRTVEAERIRGLLGVPLTVRDRVLGVLLAAKREERRFGSAEVGLLGGFAAHAAVAIDNARAAAELRRAEDELRATLALDAALRAAVLAGGDPATLVERVRAVGDVDVRWIEHPAEGPVGAALAGLAPGAVAGALTVGSCVVQPVTAAGQLFGALVVDDPATAGGADGARPAGSPPPSAAPDALLLLERAAPLIALTLVGARATARAAQLGRDIATIDLLSRAEADPAADRTRWRGAGLDPRREHVVVVAVGDPEVARRHVAALRLGDQVATAVHRDRLVLVAPVDARVEARWAGPGAPVAGLAGPVAAPADLRAAHAEAERTARALDALGRTRGLARADDLGVFAVLLSGTGRRELREQITRELGVLLEQEAVRGVPLTATLEAFLDEGRRPTATAAALGVHVNTVYQRLGTLDALLGPGWRDRSLELQVLLRLRRAVERMGEA